MDKKLAEKELGINTKIVEELLTKAEPYIGYYLQSII